MKALLFYMVLSVCLSEVAIAQTIRCPAINNDDFRERFRVVYIYSDAAGPVHIKFSLKNQFGNDAVVAEADTILSSGKNQFSFDKLFKRLAIHDSDLLSYYNTHGILPPGSYTAIWGANKTIQKHDFTVKEYSAVCSFHRKNLFAGRDSFIAEITPPDGFSDFNKVIIKYTSCYISTDDTLSELYHENFWMPAENFEEGTAYYVWAELFFGKYRCAQSEKKIVIPNPSDKDLNIDIGKFDLNVGSPSLPHLAVTGWRDRLGALAQNCTPYGQIAFETNYNSVPYYGYSYGSAWSNLSGTMGLDVYSIPFKSSFNLYWDNTSGMRKPDISLDVDFDRLMNNLKAKWKLDVEHEKQVLLNYPDLKDGLDTLEGFSIKDKIHQNKPLIQSLNDEAIKNKDKLNALNNSIDSIDAADYTSRMDDSLNNYSQAFSNQLRDELGKKRDSLQHLVSKGQAVKDSVLKVQKKYKEGLSVFNRKKRQYEDLKTKGIDLFDLKTKRELTTDDLYGYLPQKVKKYGSLAGHFKKLGMGWNHLNFSDLSISNLSMNGFSTEIESKGLKMQIARGKVANGANLNGNAPVQNAYSFNALKASLGSDISSFSMNYAQFRNRFTTDGFSDRNKVMSLQFEQKVVGNWSAMGEYARSARLDALNFAMNNVKDGMTNNLLNFSNSGNSALQIALKYAGKKGGSYAVSYREIGSSFYTAGNSFIINDRKGVYAALNRPFFKQKFVVFANVAHETNNLMNQMADNSIYNRGQFGINGKISKYLNLTAFYTPVSVSGPAISYFTSATNFNCVYNRKIWRYFFTGQLGYTTQRNQIIDQNQLTESYCSDISLKTTKIGFSASAMASSSRSFYKQNSVTTEFGYNINKSIAAKLLYAYSYSDIFGVKSAMGAAISCKPYKNLVFSCKMQYIDLNSANSDGSSSGISINIQSRFSFN